MRDLKKYEGVIPAFYACYDNQGEISPQRVRALVEYFLVKGVQGLYVNGSSGECIYQIDFGSSNGSGKRDINYYCSRRLQQHQG